jgi:dihydroorotate dehydrogenase
MNYSLIRPLLFRLDAEKAHNATLKALLFLPKSLFKQPKSKPVNALGHIFNHPVGLAAGLDKNAQHLDALAGLGFSFIEVGTVTPRPQLGNQKPRLFRLPEAHAIINRMGFNNHGVEQLVANIERSRFDGILGINIGKNKDTPLDKSLDDYALCLKKVYPHASYVTVNISSPNTPDLRKLQHGEYFNQLVSELRTEQLILADKHQRYVPLVIKLSPDETDEQLKIMADVIVSNGIDGIIATNTTCSRAGVEMSPLAKEAGGLSGAPLAERATDCVKVINEVVGKDVTIIAAGGIDSPKVAQDKLDAGATLLQVYTGLIYKGPGLVFDLVEGLSFG